MNGTTKTKKNSNKTGFAWRTVKRFSILNHLTNMELVWITNAKYLGEYRLELTFSNGTVKVFDAKDYIASRPLFAALKDQKTFSQFELDGWTVSWLNGKLDIAPEYLLSC